MSIRIVFLALFLAAATNGCIVDRRPVDARPAYNPPPPSVAIDVGFFYDSLSPFGDWFFDAEFGWVWTPYDVAIGWRPYTEGRWVYTDYGWTWVSLYDWGWAPFHYGRWQFRPRRGWIWVPGREWAPAWVAWRYGDGWAGWAPLPPGVRFRAGIGLELGVGVRLDSLIDAHYWCFVEERRLLDPRVRARIVAVPRNVTLIRATRDVTRYEIQGDRVALRGVDVDDLSRVTGRPVSRYVLRDSDRRNDSRPPTEIRSGEVHMYRPTVREAQPDRTPPGRKRPSQPTSVPTSPQDQPRPRTDAGDPAREELEKILRRERTELERDQRKEVQRPPTGVTPEELKRRHEQELQQMRARTDRQRALQEARAKRDQAKRDQAKKKSEEQSKTSRRKKSDRD